jgi:hypothetical protein
MPSDSGERLLFLFKNCAEWVGKKKFFLVSSDREKNSLKGLCYALGREEVIGEKTNFNLRVVLSDKKLFVNCAKCMRWKAFFFK